MAEIVDGHGSIVEALRATTRRTPHAAAVSDPDGSWTYTELSDHAARVAAWLAARGVGAGDRVVLRLGNTRRTVALLFGALLNGSIAVPLNSEMKAYHLSAVMADAEPAIVVGAGDDVAVLTEVAASTGCPVHDIADMWPQVEALAPAERPLPEPDSLALLIYTSGSTSTPKAVVSPHRTVAFAAEAIADRLQYGPDDIVLTAIPLAFDYGLYQVFLSVLAGAEVQLGDARFPVDVMKAITARPVTIVPIVPSLAEMLITLGRRRRPEGSAVRLFTNTGAALTPPIIDGLRSTFAGSAVVPMYGITECKRVTINDPDGDLVRPASCGTALRGTRVLIVGDDGSELGPGGIGEIAVQGPHLMAGYWRAPEISAQRYRVHTDGVRTLFTGDYGRLDADGHLYFEGRRDDMFKRRGVRMSVVEIEAAASDVAGVRAAAVFAPVDGRDLTIVAVTDLTPRRLLDALGERLEHAKVPAECVLLDALPLTPNGKTDRNGLKVLLAERAATERAA